MPERDARTIERLVCPACKGGGCATCHGFGLADRVGGRWVYWDARVDAAGIGERTVERMVRAIVVLILGAIGAIGLIFFITVAREQGALENLFTTDWTFARGDGRMLFFAFSLITDCFLFYRLASARERIGVVARPTYGAETPSTSLQRVADIMRLARAERQNVAATLTPEALRTLEQGWQLARDFRSPTLAPMFVFAALLSFQKILAIQVRLGVDRKKLAELLGHVLSRFASVPDRAPSFGPDLRALTIAAYRHAFRRRALHVDVTDLFAAIAEGDAMTRDLLDELAITPDMLENVVSWITIQEDLRRQWQYFRARARFKPKGVMNRAMTAIATPLLDRLSHDLTHLAREGYLHPCIARDRETETILRLLEGRANVLLIGNPGVGKTSMIEGLAQRMVTEDVPASLQDKRLVSLSVAELVGSSAGAGDVEERLNLVLNEVTRSGNIVLVLENVQNLIGVSSGGGATLDLSEILGSALASKQFLVIATTNAVDYRRYVEVSSGLTSTFSPVMIEEVETNAAIKILEAKSGAVEYRHHVYFSYASIERMVVLAQRYLHDRYLPEKAIALMEETAVAVRRARGANAMVSAEDVSRVVAEKTNIAVTQVTERESEKLLHLEERMHERIVGQDEAVTAVASALRRARVELRDTKRPIANFLFLGPTGVGKTELAKTVAEVYFGAEENMIRLDMSEYQEPQSVSRLIGAPPGYRGAGGGYLTDSVRSRPFSLLLLDELEKAHPDILNLFLQVMDDGRLTDSSGRTVDFTNVIIIATSNAGTEVIQENLRAGIAIEAIRTRLVEEELGRYFRPEFLNRFDQIVVFRPLSKTEVVAIAALMIRQVAKRLAEKGIALEASEAAIRELADAGFDPLFGARPLRRLIQERIDDSLAKYLLTGTIGRRDRAILEAGGAIRVVEAPSLWERGDGSEGNP